MKSRDLILLSVMLAATPIPLCAIAAKPCPPPQVSVIGGTAAATECPTAAAEDYFTSFDIAENPLSENGKWVNGQSTGLSWSNVQTASGNAFGARLVDSNGVGRYSDPIAHLSASFIAFNANQYAQATVHRVPGYENARDGHEIELLLRFEITANNARGYEVLWADHGPIVLVRWNGPGGNYTELASTDASYPPAVDGDVLRAEIGSDNRVRVYRNGILALTGPADSTFSTGQPGIGFWPTPGSTLSSYGWKDFRAGSL